MDQLNLFAGDSPARICPLPDAALDWLESEADFGLSFTEFYQSLVKGGSSSRTSLACYQATEEEILPSSFEGWSNSGIASAGGYLTLAISESPSDAEECLLSQVVEMEVQPKYYLSAKAAAGILRRADEKGKVIPEFLREALEAVANS